jgi:hypothetical protein
VYAYPSEFYELWSRERPELDLSPGALVARCPTLNGTPTRLADGLPEEGLVSSGRRPASRPESP